MGTCEEVRSSPSSVLAHSTGCQRPLEEPCGGADAIGGTCVDREPPPAAAQEWRSTRCQREGGLCVLPRRQKAKEDSVWAAIAMATRFWDLPSSTMPRIPKSKHSAHLSWHAARRAGVAYLWGKTEASSIKLSQSDVRRFAARTTLAHHKTPRGGAVCGAAAPPLGMLADRGPLWL